MGVWVMGEELIPCPFCGGAFKMAVEPQDNHPVAGMYYIFHDRKSVLSQTCRIEVRGHFYSSLEATDFWNLRPNWEAVLAKARATPPAEPQGEEAS